MAERQQYLVSFDTDRIKEYVFATQDLKKIRGASALLEFLNQEDTPRVIRETCRKSGHEIPEDHIIKGGGTAMAVVPTAELARLVIRAVERTYRTTTITCSITGTHLGVTFADLETPAFGKQVARLGAQLRQNKDAKGYQVAFPLTAYTRPCGACGRHPGLRLDPTELTQALCPSCSKKHARNEAGENRFHDHFREFVKTNKVYAAWLGVEFPESFNDIGRVSHPTNYLGFIYADGNGIGSLLEEMRDLAAYRYFATSLDKLVRDITYRALLDSLEGPRQNIAPFEILLMGGDDLMLVVAADAALEVALKITETFEVRANLLAHSSDVGLPEEKYLSLSTAVVIAHDNFPIKATHDVSGDLLRRAKRKAAEIEAHQKRFDPEEEEGACVPRGTIDFEIITEAATTGLDVLRDEVLTHASFTLPPTGGERFMLTERPYTAERLRMLRDYARAFRQHFPRTQLQAMYDALFQSKAQAQLITLTALARAEREARALGLRFFEEFGVPYASVPWREEPDNRFSTPLGDLIEIYPFA